MVARVGLIIPSSNRMVEQEMVHAYPAGVVAHVARLRMTGPHHGPLEALLPRIADAAGALMDARCEAVTFHCTATSMEEGSDGERRVLEALAAGGAKQYATTSTAIADALRALGATRLGVITPYDRHKTDHEVAFLEALGLTVVFARGYGLKGSDEYCTTPAAFWQEQAIALARPDVDAYLISCANVTTFPVLDAIEKAVGRPVISSNQAVVWDGLKRIGWRDMGGCPGSLFRAGALAA
jgi:maleate cis-trans isomerase